MSIPETPSQLLRIGSLGISFAQSEDLFRAYVETANDMVYTVDLAGNLTYVNSYGLKLLGSPAKDVLGRSCLDFVAAPHQEKTAHALRKLVQTGELRDFEFVLQPPDQGEIHLEVNGRLFHQDGELVGAIGIGRDITERKRIETKLQIYSKALESAYDSAVVLDLEGKVLYANSATSRIFNWIPEMLEGTHASVFYPERNQPRWLIEDAIAGGWSGEVLCIRRDGETFPALVSVGLILDDRQSPSAVSVIMRDITLQKHIENELEAKNLELERASQIKSDFLANMSHELRTPLTSILGFSSSLKKQIFGSLTDKQFNYVHQISQSGQHLLGLINDVLDLSKVEAGQMRLDRVPILVDELCEQTLASVSEQAKARNLQVYCEVEPNLEPLIADELRVRQMLLNLLSNAIKFSEEGGAIGIDVKAVDSDRVCLTVWDRGIGIPKDKQDLLFKPFQQVDGSLSRRHEGTGLGLALTRKLAELHYGTVDMQSKEGEGSRFSIYLPFNLPQKLPLIMIEPNRR